MSQTDFYSQLASNRAVITEELIVALKKATFQTISLKGLKKKFDLEKGVLEAIIERLILYDILSTNIFGYTLTNRYKKYISDYGGLFYPSGWTYRHPYNDDGPFWKGLFPTLFRNESITGILALIIGLLVYFNVTPTHDKDVPQEELSKGAKQTDKSDMPIPQKKDSSVSKPSNDSIMSL